MENYFLGACICESSGKELEYPITSSFAHNVRADTIDWNIFSGGLDFHLNKFEASELSEYLDLHNKAKVFFQHKVLIARISKSLYGFVSQIINQPGSADQYQSQKQILGQNML